MDCNNMEEKSVLSLVTDYKSEDDMKSKTNLEWERCKTLHDCFIWHCAYTPRIPLEISWLIAKLEAEKYGFDDTGVNLLEKKLEEEKKMSRSMKRQINAQWDRVQRQAYKSKT